MRVIGHPLAAARLTTLRDARSDNATFRSALHELTWMLVYEATADAPCQDIAVATPLAGTIGARLASPPLLVAVLRAGLGMLDAAQALLPQSRTGFVGVARDETRAVPMPYLAALPADLRGTPVLVLDPMLATGGSLVHTVGLLAERGATEITVLCVVAAPEGVAALGATYPAVRLVTAAIDEGLDANAYIIPGLGDAGDRQFGPR